MCSTACYLPPNYSEVQYILMLHYTSSIGSLLSTVMECAQNDDAQALVHTCAQNRCAQESLLLSLLPSSALFSLPLFYISLGIFWPLLVQCWFHAGSLYPLVESGPAGSFRYMRANQVRAGKRRSTVHLPLHSLLAPDAGYGGMRAER